MAWIEKSGPRRLNLDKWVKLWECAINFNGFYVKDELRKYPTLSLAS